MLSVDNIHVCFNPRSPKTFRENALRLIIIVIIINTRLTYEPQNEYLYIIYLFGYFRS